MDCRDTVDAGDTQGPASVPVQRVLFLAQVPPPVHGVTTISAAVREVMQGMPGLEVDSMWMGGASGMGDIGRRSWRKLLGFAGLLGRLGLKFVTGQRYAVSYQTLAPHGDAAIRDGLVILFSKLVGQRMLVHLHTRGLEEVLTGKGWRERLLRTALRGTELIAVSEGVARAAAEAGEFTKVHRLLNFVADPGQVACRQRGPLTLGWLGNYDPRKGVLRFVEIVAALRARGLDVRGLIAGAPTKNLSAEELDAEIAVRGLGAHIERHGFVAGAEKEAWFRRLDVFVYPTRHDLAPLVVLEAMAHGVVPIVFDTGALGELVGETFPYHVIAADVAAEATADAVGELVAEFVRQPGSLAAARVLARRAYEDRFAREAFARSLESLIRGSEKPFVQQSAMNAAELQTR